MDVAYIWENADWTVQARNIAKAIAYVLETQGQEYHGGPESVEIKTIDEAAVKEVIADLEG